MRAVLDTSNMYLSATIANPKVYLKRAHIFHLLEDALQKPVITIVAGAGYGKTQAVYAFLQEYGAVTLWLQLSAYDNITTRFWENFVYCASMQDEKLAQELTSLGFPDTAVTFDRFVKIMGSAMRKDKKYILVCDDFHLITDKKILQFFNNMITAANGFSFIFISRTEPDINIVGLLSKNLITCISENDFILDRDEVAQYFALQNIKVSARALVDICDGTEGWIFAIHLVGLALKHGGGTEEYALSAMRQNIFKLIEREVFSAVSKEMQLFLIKLSLLESVPRALLIELFPNHDEFIGYISRINSFIRYDGFTDTYRIHHLFLSFLVEKQDQIDESEKKNIYLKSAKWYAEHGGNIDAIICYEKTGDYDEIVHVCLNFPAKMPREMAMFVLSIINRIPPQEYERHGILSVLHARIFLSLGRFEESKAKLCALIQKQEALPLTEENRSVLCEAHVCLGAIKSAMNDYYDEPLVLHYKKAAEYMPAGSKIISSRLSWNTGAYSCHVDAPEKGELDRYIDMMEQVRPYYSVVSNGLGQGMFELQKAEVAFFRRDLANAQKYIGMSITKAQGKNQYHIENAAWFYKLRIQLFSGNYAKIRQTMDTFWRRVQEQNKTDAYTIYDIASGWIYAMLGQIDEVPSWIKDDLENNWDASLSVFNLDILSRARYHLAAKNYVELLTLMSESENCLLRRYLFGRIEMALLEAVALYYTDQHGEAFEMLEMAYQLANPNRLELPFIEHGNHMRVLTKAAMQDKNCMIPEQWLDRIHIKASTYSKKLIQIITEYRAANNQEDDLRLSKREVEILTDIYHGLTREEIAANQNISINTVKGVIQSIYSKMGAVNAVDAVRIALTRNLLK